MYRDNFGRDLWVNALQFENMFGKLKAEASLSHSYTNKYTRSRYGDDGANFEYNNEKKYAPGTGVWGGTVSYVKNRPKDIPAIFDIYDNMNPADADSAWLAGWVTAKREEFFQHVYNAAADFTYPTAFSDDITATFKVGGKYTRTTRDNDVQSYFTGSTDGDTYATVHRFFPGVYNDENHRLTYNLVRNLNYKRGQYYMKDEYDFKNGGFKYGFNADLLDDWYRKAMPGWQPDIKVNESLRDDFNGAEQFSAGYVMGTFDIFSKLTLITGLRYERYNMKYKANFVYVTHNIYGDAISPDTLNRVDRSDENIFPNVQLRFKFNDWSDVRFAYTKGVSRPDYLSIVPRTYVEFNRDITVGNTKLRPTISNNLDANVSFYSNEIGLLTVGGFYKKMTDVFFNTAVYYKQLSKFPDISVPDQATLLDLGFKDGPKVGSVIRGSLNNANPGLYVCMYVCAYVCMYVCIGDEDNGGSNHIQRSKVYQSVPAFP
jgi:outer membrane receptor protein involved in Fe transport